MISNSGESENYLQTEIQQLSDGILTRDEKISKLESNLSAAGKDLDGKKENISNLEKSLAQLKKQIEKMDSEKSNLTRFQISRNISRTSSLVSQQV
jgi:chromosome segregation ATPase